MSHPIDEFRRERQEGTARVLAADHLGIKLFFDLDTAAHRDGAPSLRPLGRRAG